MVLKQLISEGTFFEVVDATLWKEQICFFRRGSLKGGVRLRKYAIEENYRAASRMGIENSGEGLLTETTDWFQELLWDFRAKACHGFRTSRPSILL